MCYNIPMPANLPPQFHAVSAKLKQTEDPTEKISILEELLAIMPKHKGTEKLRKDIKTKIAKLKKQKPKKVRREALYLIEKEGAGQIVIVGPTNAGKSSLLNILTNAKTKVAAYPFTTQVPKPGIMPYEDISVQLIDTPPLGPRSPGWLKEILKSSDGLLAVFDLSKEKVEEDIKNIKELFNVWKITDKKIIFVGNKIDLARAKENLEKINPQYGLKTISCSKRVGLEELKREIFNMLNIIRVYTKSPGTSLPDLEHPFVLKKQSLLAQLAREIHHDFTSSFKYAKLFKKGSRKPRIIGKNYILQDRDIIEIHA